MKLHKYRSFLSESRIVINLPHHKPKGEIKSMAKLKFWVEIDKLNDVVEIPDSDLDGLSDEEREKVILKHHVKWVDRNLYGDWTEIK
ncbi:hypothetical protein D3C76_221990 [compost metagenome]